MLHLVFVFETLELVFERSVVFGLLFFNKAVLQVIYLLLKLTDLVFVKAFLLVAFEIKVYLHYFSLFALILLLIDFKLITGLLHLIL